jgi:hypothetical protein
MHSGRSACFAPPMQLPVAQWAADDGRADGVDVNRRRILILDLPGAGKATLADALAPVSVLTSGRLASRLSALNYCVDTFIAV